MASSGSLLVRLPRAVLYALFFSNQGNRKVIIFTPGGKGSGMLGVMYRITKDASGVILVCLACPHTERVNEFNDRLGSRRTQAAGAMLKHVHNEHGKVPIVKPLPRVMERMY